MSGPSSRSRACLHAPCQQGGLLVNHELHASQLVLHLVLNMVCRSADAATQFAQLLLSSE